MKKVFDNFTIEYTKDDLSYIENLIQQFLVSYKKIMNFLELNILDNKVQIKIWDDIEEYEKYIKSKIKKYMVYPLKSMIGKLVEQLLIKMKVKSMFYLIKNG